jgi:pyrroloquinoline quinone biosynthesis protein E
MLPGIEFPNVRTSSVESVWYESEGFNHFRGDSWMKEPCRSCPEKHKDFGGCRCQAYLMTGDPANADPVCDLSPHHHLVTEMVEKASAPQPLPPPVEKPLLFRDRKNSRSLSGL